MKILGLPALLLIFWAKTTLAQSFEPIEGHVLQKQLGFNEANLCFIHFKNLSGDTLNLKWRRLEIAKPEDWKIDLCDYGACYVGVPSSGTMNPLVDTAQGYLKLIVQPGTTPGAAWLWFRVFDLADDSNFHDVYFSLHTAGTSAVEEVVEAGVQIFPNPAADFFQIKNHGLEERNVQIFNTLGQVFFEKKLLPGAAEEVRTSDWRAGSYFLKTEGTVQKLIVQR